MKDESKTKKQLISELKELRGQMNKLNNSEKKWGKRQSTEKKQKKQSPGTFNFWQSVIDTIPNPIFYKDKEGIYRGCNKGFEDYIGLKKNELIGKTVYDIAPRDLADKYHQMDSLLFRRQEKQMYEHQVKYTDGSIHDVIFYKSSYLNVDGTIAGLVGVMVDITQRKRTEERLKKSEEQIRLLLNSTAEAIYGIDLQDKCTFANPSCLRMLGYANIDQLLGKKMHQLIHHSYPDGRPMAVEDCRMTQAFLEGRGMHVDDEVLWKADGSSFPVEYWSYPQVLNDSVYGAVVTFIDITERLETEKKLASEKQRLSYILEGTNVGTWEWNVQTGEAVFNERWAEIIGYTLAELAPVSIETWIKYTHPDDLQASGELLAKHFQKELSYYECEARMRHKNGGWIWVLDRGKVATWTDDGKPLIMSGTHQDITERKRAEEKIQHMATHDWLTDLPTLRLAEDRLASALGMSRRRKNLTAVMFIDLDGFKTVNDTLGHEAGDYVLKQVAQRLLACVRETDTVGRVGGDEFLIIATDLHVPGNAVHIAEKLIQTVSYPINLDSRMVTIGASIGIALYPAHAKDIEELIRKADEAMYRVKNAGKNGYSFADAAPG